MRSTTSISIKDTKILDLSIKKTWQHELPSDNRKKQKHSARNRLKYIFSVPLFRLNV